MIKTEEGRSALIVAAKADGMIRIVYHPPLTGILGPYASGKAGHVYQVFSQRGSKLVGVVTVQIGVVLKVMRVK